MLSNDEIFFYPVGPLKNTHKMISAQRVFMKPLYMYYIWKSNGICLLISSNFNLTIGKGGGCQFTSKSWSLWEWCWISILHLLLTVGPFESDALLVPQHCHFYHEHNQCDTYKKWGDWATADCQAKDMRIDSFSMLLDCDIDRFAGVEYVCCPKEKSKSSIISPVRQCLPSVCTGDGMHSLSCKQIVIRKQKINRWVYQMIPRGFFCWEAFQNKF